MQDSSALVLEIFRQDSLLKMSLFEHSQLASTLRHYSQRPVSFGEIEKLCDEATLILNKANRKDSSGRDLIKELAKTGQLLWDNLLTRPVRDKLRASPISDLILSLDEELIDIPWELLYDGRNFLCLVFNIGRVVRTKEELTLLRYRDSSVVVKMLILSNPTGDLKSAYLEGLNIKNQFDRKRNNVHIDFKSTSIDKLYVKKHFCDYDIVHFAGHCEYEIAHPEDSGWVLSDGKLAVLDILSMGSTVWMPALVFSNACSSATAAPGLIDTDYQEKNYSLASAFLFSGVRHYIGAIRSIEDSASLGFAREFYTQLISASSVGEAVRLARAKLIKDYGLSSLHWASYLVYGNPNFTLFRPKPKLPRKPPKEFILAHKKKIAWLTLSLAAISIGIYLYMYLPSLNPSSYFLFLRSKELFQRGANEEVILACNRLIKQDPFFLSAYPLLADTYQRMGDREGALKYFFDYALLSEKRNDKKNLASAYIEIGWFYHLEGESAKALDFYNKAISLAKENKDKLNTAVALRKLAVWHIDKGNYDSALGLLTKSSEINRERQHIPGHRYNLACDYFDIGLVFTNKDDLEAAKAFYQKSRAVFTKLKLRHGLSDYYFNLGEICLFEKQYQQALDYYLVGLKIDESQGNKMNLSGDYNMLGELYLAMDNLAEAEKSFMRAALISKAINRSPELAESLYNLGLLYKKKGSRDRARGYFRQAQEIYRSGDISTYEEIKKELLDLDGRE